MWNQLIQLSFRSKVGLQAQIREMLVAAILDGHIPVGVALPSTHVLAAQLGVARNTVALAYELLVNEGYLLTKDSMQYRAVAFALPIALYVFYTYRVLPGMYAR